ncbi:hypothetical protein E2C01_063217 [Portunus trituberculatus]|uniref:Uncharacterized protein n=1 Tax=Portunus trituberculatus TaxID=210409 RepID=A0A5B7HK76_PORTR|nr:hypothetical protein [Portunus trituberculatus]
MATRGWWWTLGGGSSLHCCREGCGLVCGEARRGGARQRRVAGCCTH